MDDLAKTLYNPSLREETRHKVAEVIPLKQESSLLDWLENTGRLIARDALDQDYLEDEGEDIADLMTGDDVTYELEDDDDDEVDLEIV